MADAAVAALALFSLGCAWMLSAGGALHGNDFKHLWAGSWLLAHGGNPYDPAQLFHIARRAGLDGINPYVYLPTTGLFLYPLTLLSYLKAKLAWFWINWALAWGLVLAGPALLRVGRPALARLAGAAFLAGAFPFMRQMTAGQMNVVTAWLILLAAAALRRRREGLAGAALGLGFAWKIAPALLIVTLAVQRRTRAALAGALTSALLLALSLAWVGVPVHRAALPILRQMGYGQSTWSEQAMDFYRSPFNQSPNALMHHLFTANHYSTPWLALTPAAANGLTWLISLALLGAWLAAAWRQAQGPTDTPGGERTLDLFFAASLLMLLLPSLLWDHYVVQALPALLWLFGQERAIRQPGRALALLAILLGLAILWPHESPLWRHGLGIPLMSLRLWPLLALYGLLLRDALHSGQNQ